VRQQDIARGDMEVYDTSDEKVLFLEREQLPEPALNYPWGTPFHSSSLFISSSSSSSSLR
jgi:hypothetical protein